MDLLQEFGCTDCPEVVNPLDCTFKLQHDVGDSYSNPTKYRKLVVLTDTRLDIAFSVQHLSQFM